MTQENDDPFAETRDTRVFYVSSEQTEVDPQSVGLGSPTTNAFDSTDSGSYNRFTSSALDVCPSIAGFRIIRKIGEGGMGIVFEAEQQRPRRRVALKVIRGGLYSNKFYLRMFEREIQTLARLEHPGIVSIYEAGRITDGQVYFAMELLNGRSLLDFVEELGLHGNEALSVTEKLKLFLRICEIVSYAHQHAVIHRDLKPQNIYVLSDAGSTAISESSFEKVRVKILDFGLARITDPEFAEGTDVSQVGQIKGTLTYMSPEQLTGNPADIDVRSDVYTLGLILYEMVAGRLPYEVRNVPVPEAMRIISEEPPQPLYKSVSTSIGIGRRSSARVDKDVETIVLKSLEKEPERRYQSVAAMIDDVERYLNDQPIGARPPSALYNFRKLVLRHKVLSASVSAIILMLLGFGIVTASQSARVADERDKAVAAEQEAEERRVEAETARGNEQRQRVEAEQNLELAMNERRRAEEQANLAEAARRSEAEQREIAEHNLKDARRQKAVAEESTQLALQQRSIAEQRKKEADEQRAAAENETERNRRLVYVSQMNLAQQAWEHSDIARMDEFLENQIPKPNQTDLRGFEWYYLWRLGHQDRWSRQIIGSRVSAGFSPDGKVLAVSELEDLSDPGAQNPFMVTRLLNAATGRELGKIDDQFILNYMPQGSMLTINKDGGINIVDTERKVIIPTGIPDYLKNPGKISPDGKWIATVSGENVIVREILSGADVVKIPWSPGKVSDRFKPLVTDWSPNGKIIAIKYWSDEPLRSSMVLYEIATGKKALTKFIPEISDVVFSPDGKLIATTEADDLKIWDAATMTEVGVLKGLGKSNAASPRFNMTISADSKFLAVGRGASVEIYDLGTKQRLSTIKGHEEFLRTFRLSPAKGELATIGYDNKLKFWRFPYSEQFAYLDKMGRSTIAPNGQIIATTGQDGEIAFWDLDSKRALNVAIPKEIGPEQLFSIQAKSSADIIKRITGASTPEFSPDGKSLARTSREGIVEIWDVAKREMSAITPPGIVSYAFMAESDRVVSATRDGKIVVWNVSTKKLESSFEATENASPPPASILISPGGRVAAVLIAAPSPAIRLMDVTTGKQLNQDLKFTERPANLRFSLDGSLLAYTIGRSVKIMSIATGLEVPVSFSQAVFTSTKEFSPTGQTLAVVAGPLTGRNVILIDTSSGREIGRLKGHRGLIASMKFSADGKRLVTSSVDGSIKIWDVTLQQALISLQSEDYFPFFTPDGRTLITSGPTGTRIWTGASDAEIAAYKAGR